MRVYYPCVPGILQTNMSPYTVHCKSCCRTYDGNAQCCVDMDHVRVESFADHLEEIRPLVESNPELLRRLKAMQKLYDDEVLTNEEVGNDLNQAYFELNAKCALNEEINGDTTGQLVSTINRLCDEKDEEGDKLLDEMRKQEEINGDVIMQLVSTNSRLTKKNEELQNENDKVWNSLKVANEELRNETEPWWESLDAADAKAKIDKDSIKLLTDNMYRLETENDELKKQTAIMRAPADEYYANILKY